MAVAVAPSHKSEARMAKRAGWMIYGANGFTGHLVAAEDKRLVIIRFDEAKWQSLNDSRRCRD